MTQYPITDAVRFMWMRRKNAPAWMLCQKKTGQYLPSIDRARNVGDDVVNKNTCARMTLKQRTDERTRQGVMADMQLIRSMMRTYSESITKVLQRLVESSATPHRRRVANAKKWLLRIRLNRVQS